ncbi:hypothetical protein C5B89_18590 [Haloferax sp. Atlit-47N]|uniref:hypothetical protein n=1 Tax=Haloferax sp. Atlit-47N TaxID=2077199 RepID=UPI000E250B5D|nr:hypothetical protein [Haloferax sp. Atlit-47N]RDZ35718.1 hypothetical protein C5B89_18590 [Haloferax sp. Atlit-47N]
MARNNLSERWEEYYSTAIQKGLKAALADVSIEKSFDEFDDGHIKLNKLMYVAMAERGLHEEMQHSWHRYGGDLGTLVPSTRTVGPVELDDLPETEQPQQPRPSGDNSRKTVWDESDYREFFKTISIGSLESLNEILEASRATLLEEFYTEYSGEIEDWVDLYLINVRIQEVLHLYAEDDLGQFDNEAYMAFAETLEAFERELYSHSELSPDHFDEYDIDLSSDENPADLLTDFLDLVDDIYFTISQQDLDEFSGDLSYQLSMVEEFYHERAWNLVTKVISLHTMHGPNQEALLYGSISDLEQLVNGFSIRMERIESECRAADLLPNSNQFRSPEADSRPGQQLPTRDEFRQALKGDH